MAGVAVDPVREQLLLAAATAYEADQESDEFISWHSMRMRQTRLEAMKFALVEGNADDFDRQHAAFWDE